MIVMESPFQRTSRQVDHGRSIDVKIGREDVRGAVIRRAQVVRQNVLFEMAHSPTPQSELTARLKLGVEAAVQGRTVDLSGLSDSELVAALCS